MNVNDDIERKVASLGVPADIPVDAATHDGHEHGPDCNHGEEAQEAGRKTQNMLNPFASVNWEPAPGTIQLSEDSPLAKKFTKFEVGVVRKHPYAWDAWGKIRKDVPRSMQNLIRSMWETYWRSPGMGPEAFRTVLALVRRKIGLPYSEEVLHKLQAGNEQPLPDEQEEQAVSEVCEDGESGSGASELGEVSDDS